MKKLKDPCTKLRTQAGQNVLDQLDSGKLNTNGSNSSSLILSNLQSQLNHIERIQQEETDTISIDSGDDRDQSEDGHSSLGVPDSPADSD